MSPRISTRVGTAGWAVLAVLLACPGVCLAQISAEESAKKLKPADGLEAKLWASEPMVHNPTNMDVDSRGRVWITEGLNYRLTRGGNRQFPKIEEADRVKILEDTDGDGKADKMTVFADHIFPVPMGIAVEENYDAEGKYRGCKVYIGNSPDLLVLEDADGDDKADKRYPLLTGFGGIDSDHGVHGMVLALDGKLYFTHGDGCCSVQQDHSERQQNFDVVDKSGRHVKSDQLAHTLRVNRDGTQFEILCDRQRNNYETCFTSFGNIFTSDNDDDGNRGCRVIQAMDGGHYGYRTPGSPRHWGEEVPGNVPKLVGTGNGSPCGIMVYEGSLFPREFQGAILEADAGTRQINHFPLTRHGSTFQTEYKVFLASDDPWFRPVDMTAAPDGSIFVADWYDAGVGGHAFKDQTTGRIYRVTPKGKTVAPVKHNFSHVPGMIVALRSPCVATQDAARRSLSAHASRHRAAVEPELVKLFSSSDPIERARALWVLSDVNLAGDKAAIGALNHSDPRIREQAVRMLGRDDRENGVVEYKDPAARKPPAASTHLADLLPLAADPDPSVRRELIQALRNLPTSDVGDALKTLTRAWDGRDRWYLEALGLALEKRETAFIVSLFDGTLFGDLDLEKAGGSSNLALPPYFPADRNESYIVAGAPDLPVSPLSKTLGLAWRLHRADSLNLLARVIPALDSPTLQQAADDVLGQIRDPETAVMLANLAKASDDPSRKRQILSILARKLDNVWRGAKDRGEIVDLTETALADSELTLPALGVVAATEDPRYASKVIALARDSKASDEIRATAVESAARLKDGSIRPFLTGLIADARGKTGSIPTAEAAVRMLGRVGDPRKTLAELVESKDYPLGLRREALRVYASLNDGGLKLVALAKEGKLAADLKNEATLALNAHPDRNVRTEANKVLPMGNTQNGRKLPSFFELVRREGKADQGREVFFREGSNSCATCHRVQGRGQWVGPDLSTIGTKYGRDELLRSILTPSSAIGYNFRSLIVSLDDGRVITGLPVEDSPERLVLKTADGQRVVLRPGQVDARKTSDVSLMPDALAETMTDTQLVDLLAFLSTLKRPVSLVGQYQAIGPVAENNGKTALDPAQKIDLTSDLIDPDGRKLLWRRLDANAESLVDLSTLAGTDPSKAVYLYAPIVSPIAQQARLVLDTKANVSAWLGGKLLAFPDAASGQERAVEVDLSEGSSDLLIRINGGPSVSIVTTVVSEKPVAFRTDEVKVPAR
jgi:putative membrane-bound dehydrogenase-like protein